MTRSASQLLHAHVGAPSVEGEQTIPETPCWNCAGPYTRAVPLAGFIKVSLTDQNTARAPRSDWVCSACVYVRARFSPVPGRPPKEGKTQGGRFCNYTHMMCGNEYENASKGEKPRILAFLRKPHASTWFAAIADSGQKHTLPYAPVNPPGVAGRVRFDEATIQIGDWAIVDDMIALLTAGATKEEIERGQYEPRAWTICREELQAFEATHAPQRGSAWFRIALWLSQRDEETVQARMSAEKDMKAAKAAEEKLRGKAQGRGRGAAPHDDGRGADPPARAVPVDVPEGGAEALGSDPDAHAERGEAQRYGGRVGDAAAARPATPGPEQLSLFGGT